MIEQNPDRSSAWLPGWIPAWFTRSRRRLWLLALLGFAALLFLAALADAAFGQGRALCGDRQAIGERLAERFDERATASGLTDGGALLEVLAAPGGSWTLLLTRPGGPACVLVTGQNWRTLRSRDDPRS